jgi:hypothetical protein
MLKELVKHIHIIKAILSWFLSWVLTVVVSNVLCNPMHQRDEGYIEYFYNASPYCQFYDGIYGSFFSFGDNNFINLFLFTLLGYLVALLIEIILTIIDYIRIKFIENPYIAAHEIEIRDGYDLLNELSIQIRLVGFLGFFLSNWFVGGI